MMPTERWSNQWRGRLAQRHKVITRSDALRVALDMQRLLRQELSDAVSPAARRIFLLLALEPYLTLTQLSSMADISESIASRTVDALHSTGLVTKCVDPMNRRRRIVSLSDAGRAISSALARDVAKLIRRACK